MRCAACRTENPASQSFCGTCGKPLPPEHAQAADAATTAEHGTGELATGSTFAGRYQVVEELGRGGMGHVYKAIDTSVKDKIALKVLPPEMAADRDALERFSRELQLARRITHRNVCRLFDLGKSDGIHYLTMEFVPGEDLKRLIRKVGALGAGKIVRIARELCDGLAEAHRLGIVHRDLKPQNIMVDEDGNAKILDFGIARSVRSKSLTGPGVLIGTPQYMSPEQVDGEDVDPRADLYSLGIILYEMATGQVPFDGDAPLSVAHKQKYDMPADPRTLNAELSPDLGALILKCLAKDKEARYQSASEVRADLDRIEQGLPTTERALARKHTTSTQITIPLGPRWLLAAAAALVVVVAAVFVWRPWAAKVPVSPKSGKPTVAVTWFDNQSDRADLDRALTSLLTTNLSRDEALEVVSTQRMFDILRQIRKGEAKTIDRAVATEVATRAGAGTMVTGSIVKLGEQVRITAELVNVATGGVVTTIQEDGKRIDDVFSMVDRLTEQIRLKLGLSMLASAKALKVTDVSTSSLDAYEHYQKGFDWLLRWNNPAAIKELEQAVAIDPTFAGAWVVLAQARVVYEFGLNPFAEVPAGADAALREARKYASKATEWERLQTDLLDAGLRRERPVRLERATALVARYPEDLAGNLTLTIVRYGMGDLTGARAAAERYLELNPSDANTYNMLAYIQSGLGDHEAAVSSIKKYVALHPDVENAYDSAWEIYIKAGQLDEALAIADRLRQLRPNEYYSWYLRGTTFLMRDDPERARQEFLSAQDLIPTARVTQANHVGYAYLVEGRYRDAEAMFRKAVVLADAVRKDTAPGTDAGIAEQRGAHFTLGQMLTVEGRTAEAIREFQAGEDASAQRAGGRPDPYAVMSRYLIGATLARNGDQTGALRRAGEIRDLVKTNGLNTELLDYAEFLVAQVADARGDRTALGEALDRVTLVHRRSSTRYWRLAAARSALDGNVSSALAIYERIRVDEEMSRHYGGQEFIYFHERSRLGYTVGRLYEQQHDAVKAREQYRRFVSLMARADPGIPDVEDAKSRLAALGRR